MNVLSLFDGISCGQVALERAGIKYDKYYASEIDKNAIKITMKNYPNTIQLGDVTKWKDWDINWASIDLLIGGSPCQDLCGMGSRQGLKGQKSKLFFEYVDILHHIQEVNKNVKFLLENNASMTKQNKEIMSEYIGCQPVLINSSDFSAQIRKRLYWSNIPFKKHIPKNIFIKDILENSIPRQNVSEKIYKYVFSGQYLGRKIEKTTRCSIRTPEQKSRTIGTCSYDISSNAGLTFKIGGEYFKPNQIEFERLQTLPDNYTDCLPIKQAVFHIGNGWTVDVIAHIFRFLPKD